jgi:hypothetical protein
MAANTSSSNENVDDSALVHIAQWHTAANYLATLPPQAAAHNYGLTAVEDLVDARGTLLHAIQHIQLVVRCRDVQCFYDPTIRPNALVELQHRVEDMPRYRAIVQRSSRYRHRIRTMLDEPSVDNLDRYKTLAEEMARLLEHEDTPEDVRLIFQHFEGIRATLLLVRSIQEGDGFDSMIGMGSQDGLHYLAAHYPDVLTGCRALWLHMHAYLSDAPADNLPPLPLPPPSPTAGGRRGLRHRRRTIATTGRQRRSRRRSQRRRPGRRRTVAVRQY